MPGKLNIGCGHHFLPDWENLDFESRHPAVRKWDIRRGLPYPDGHFDLVYSSHVLEHLKPAEAEKLLRECHRVLRQGGTLRVVVPDLEAMARGYVAAAEAAAAKRGAWSREHGARGEKEAWSVEGGEREYLSTNGHESTRMGRQACLSRSESQGWNFDPDSLKQVSRDPNRIPSSAADAARLPGDLSAVALAKAEDCKTWNVKRKTCGEGDREKSEAQPRSTFYVSRSTGTSASLRHTWSTVFLIDQLTRTEPGGEMGKMLEAFEGDIPDFIKEQLGQDWVDGYMPHREHKPGKSSMIGRIIAGLRWRGRLLRQRVVGAVEQWLPGLADLIERWKIAGYLKSGERHQWMYDGYSLAELLERCGFVNPVILSHTETDSGCDDVIKLDADEAGRPYKPMSVYAESGKAPQNAA